MNPCDVSSDPDAAIAMKYDIDSDGMLGTADMLMATAAWNRNELSDSKYLKFTGWMNDCYIGKDLGSGFKSQDLPQEDDPHPQDNGSIRPIDPIPSGGFPIKTVGIVGGIAGAIVTAIVILNKKGMLPKRQRTP